MTESRYATAAAALAAAGSASAAKRATDDEVAAMLDSFSDDLEREGRCRSPQWMREAAKRLRAR